MKTKISYSAILIFVILIIIFSVYFRGPPITGKTSAGITQASITILDIIPPIWRNQSQKCDIVPQNAPNILSVECWDVGYLAYAVLSTNETSSWVNWTGVYDSPQYLGNASQTWTWANFTWQNSSVPIGTIVGWKVYCNDTSGNVNVTDVSSFTISSPDLTPPIIHWIEDTPDPVYQGDPIEFKAYVTDPDICTELDSVWWEIESVNYTYESRIVDLYFFNSFDTSIPPGIYNYTVYANDTAGNIANATGNFTVILPVPPPKPPRPRVKKYCQAEIIAPAAIPTQPGRIQVSVELQNTGSTLTNIIPSIEALPFDYSVSPTKYSSLRRVSRAEFKFTIDIPPGTREGVYHGDYKFTTAEGCVFSKGFVIVIGPPAAPPRILKLDIEGVPKTCSEEPIGCCEEYVNYVRTFEVFDFKATIKNIGNLQAENLEFDLILPEGWQATGPHTYKRLYPDEIIQITWQIAPNLQLEPSTEIIIVQVLSNGNVIASEPIELDVRVPDFAVLPEPSLTLYKDQSTIKVYTIINNKAGRIDLKDLTVEYNLNECGFGHTLVLDFLELGSLKAGEALVVNRTYSLVEPFQNRVYSMHGVLYQQGNWADESYRPLDLRKRIPVKVVFAIGWIYTAIVLLVAGLVAGLLYWRKKAAKGKEKPKY